MQKIFKYREKGFMKTACLGHEGIVIFSLLEEHLDKSYVLLSANLYNSVSLSKLITQHFTYLCGTLRFHGKGNPKDLIQKKNKRRSGKDQMRVLCANRKTKETCLPLPTCISLKWFITKKNGRFIKKPNIIRNYSNEMSGVDRCGQMQAFYSSSKIHYISARNLADGRRITSLQFRIAALHHLVG